MDDRNETVREWPPQVAGSTAAMKIQSLKLGDMENLVYLIEDTATNKLAVIDPAWDVKAILEAAGDRVISDILVSHWHDDHVNGVDELVAATGARVHLLQMEADFWKVKNDMLTCHNSSDSIQLGDLNIQLLHTPGHSPGSVCFYADGCLFTGDTLFVYGCGRCDLAGGDPEAMYHSLNRLQELLPGSTRVYPGHDYADVKVTTLSEQQQLNPFMHQDSAETFVAFRNEHNNHRHPPYRPVKRGEAAW